MALTCLYIFNQVRFKKQNIRTRCYICLTAMVQLNRSNRLLVFLRTMYLFMFLSLVWVEGLVLKRKA